MNGEKTSPTEYKYGSVTVRKASIADFPELEEMAARAFNDAPFENWICFQDRHRKERIKRFMSLSLRLVLPYGEIYTTQDRTGVAGWIPPGKTDARLGALPMVLPKWPRVIGVKRAIPFTISFLIVALVFEKHHPKTPNWQLQPLAVEPSLQGKGIGTALLQPILNRCDQDRIPAYLGTQMEKNVRFYEHRGFKVIKYLEKLPFGAPNSWIMWREPR